MLFGLFHTLYAMSPAAPLPPPTPVTGEVVHYRHGQLFIITPSS